MLNNKLPSTHNGPAPPNAPAQTPTQFANALVDQSREINVGLRQLRNRLFGDDEAQDVGPNEPKEAAPNQLDTLAKAHWGLNQAREQLEAIHNRL
jgi:hypothetical protein